MGTGGGERLLALSGALPADTVATEGWGPNIAVARRALAPHGIPVLEYDPKSTDRAARRMPFEDGRFELAMSRHEAYVTTEVARVLAPGGVFLTQQVGGDDIHELHDLLGGEHIAPHVQYDRFTEELAAAGLVVEDGRESAGEYLRARRPR